MSTSENLPEIDEGLYSRQLYVLGYEAMQKIATAAVLVSGMKGLGVEIAKNIVLAGVKSVTVHDQHDAQWSDLSSQFFLSEEDVGQNRAVVSQHRLKELNRYVPVLAYTQGLSECFLSAFQVVVLTNSPLEEQLRISDFCHANNICFVLADTKGLAGQLFCDFGEHFVVYDASEAEPVSAVIQHITQGYPGVLTVASENEQGRGHQFENGDWVTFKEVEGMTELNTLEPHPIHVAGQYSLEIGDTSSFSPYKSGGIVTQVKMPQQHSFDSLRVSMRSPKIKTPDAGKMSRYHTLHMAFWALHLFQSKMKRLPKPRNQADAEDMVKLAWTLATVQEPLADDLVRTFAYGCTADLNPITAFFGAVAAQEVLKAASGKFTPLNQWLYFDAYECLPEEDHGVLLTEEDCAPRGSRYDGQLAIFGADFQKQLGKQKYFVVGAGAIGCELLKNLAMIGLAACEGGNITVTDMDKIEYSNLNRQFLFRPQDVSKWKSEVAAAAIKLMNPSVSVTAEQNQVGSDTECYYGDEFFLGLDGVATALDSLQARAYVGKQCTKYLKPLLDSGTEGTKGHVQVLMPFVTEPYGHAVDRDEDSYPLCTLRYFPTTIQHTLQWARDQFEGLFRKTAETVNKFLQDPSFSETEEAEVLEVLELVQASLQEKPHSWGDCVAWARRLWERLFSHDIQQLQYNFPPDHKTISGLPFRSGPKQCPEKLDFNFSNVTHRTFLLAASHLLAQMHRLNVSESNAPTRQILLDLHLLPFQPRNGVHIPVTDEEMQMHGDAEVGKELRRSSTDEIRLAELRQDLARLRRELEEQDALFSSRLEPIHFEKDDDSNSHLDFIVMAANLRAENYGIPPADKLQAKRIVGRIVPAIATTTAAVAGLVCLELYKLVWGHRRLSSYRSTFLRLSEPLLHRCQPHSPQPAYKYRQKTWSCWERIEVPGVDDKGEEITLKGLCDHLQREHGLELQMLVYGKTMIYHGFWEEEKREKQLSNRLTELVCATAETVSKDCRLLVFQIVCDNEEDDADLPPVHVQFPPMKGKNE
ncbi:PREDICTED: LOW QUALITY PROTEIN: ubiquitin-like modifier-activating enzyme 7 [Gekko japonicus]|uniref:LOW QUALITY PROTEIN: ubiquitin-like modifier-activating enzyme 7 n=1 Tax=Gekko japonicus TaxID=146911 RepID=A0ABM1JN55_GEKJA|nr:PREDICTED: LOW QUALITY PROTEIN: ubiquitin-like modifier-activating enzyme 7 [Gekko japonicus]